MSDDRSKRPKLDSDSGSPSRANGAVIRLQRAAFLSTLSRPVSPPPRSTSAEQTLRAEAASEHEASRKQQVETSRVQTLERSRKSGSSAEPRQVTEQLNLPRTLRIVHSPFQLVKVADPSYPARYNHDTITIKDTLGDPLIKQAWMFNYLFNVDWVMQQFDPDIRDLVEVTIIHGFWKRESENKLAIDEACSRYTNVKARAAWLEDPFGTHHTKMFILFRHDGCAQVVIHTANMIQKDWSNMTDAVWRSPQLPLRPYNNGGDSKAPLGSGQRFKHDLIEYLKAYGEKTTGQVVEYLSHYDFSSVRGALIGSVPDKLSTEDWGSKALRRATSFLHSRNNLSIVKNTRKREHEAIPTSNLTQPSTIPTPTTPEQPPPPHLVIQVSSVASLPAPWLSTFLAALGASPATWSLIYPTVSDIRASLYGYYSGGSIFMKTTATTANQNQLASLRPHLCHWATPGDAGTKKQAGRGPAAPHIKTYTCFTSRPSAAEPAPEIKWALLTSANLSRQAWGVEGKDGKGLKISSYELGVMVWPDLYLTDEEVEAGVEARMVPCFGRVAPDPEEEVGDGLRVGLRMPYDLPLTPYGSGEMPWDGGKEYTDVDRNGGTWLP